MCNTLTKNIFIFVVFIIISNSIYAQQSNFTPLTSEDVEVKDDTLFYLSGFDISGDYRLHVKHIQGEVSPLQEIENDDPQGFNYEHELRLNFRSIVHRHISINLELELDQDPIQEADIRTRDSATENRTPDSRIANIQARQAFLEYNSNPANILRFGKQYINIGDRKGKVFSGILTGASQNCKLGTWCYELGAMKLGTHPADWLYYGALDYPVFDEVNALGETAYKLDVGIYRILYTERDVPLGKSNGPTFRNQTEFNNLSTAFESGDAAQLESARQLARQVTDRDGQPIFYDAIEHQYFGLNLNWQWAAFHLNFDAVASQGQRKYHINTKATGVDDDPNLNDTTNIFKTDHRSRNDIAGIAIEWEMFYQFKINQLGFRLLYTSGDNEKKDLSDEGKNYLRFLNGYYEIIPGSYRGTNFYFNGGGNDLTQGTGLGHSINNITMFGGWFKTKTDLVQYKLMLFQLERTRPVLNVDKEQVKDIGIEWDNTLTLNIDKNLSADFEVNAFFPGDAFSYDDNEDPLETVNPIYHAVSRLQYSFK